MAYTLTYHVVRNRLPQVNQMRDVQQVVLDLGELVPFGLQVQAGSDATTWTGTVIERSLVVEPSPGSTFLADYPTLDVQRAVLTNLYTARLALELACPVTALPVS